MGNSRECRFTGCTNPGVYRVQVALRGVEQLRMDICAEHHAKLMPRTDGYSFSVVSKNVGRTAEMEDIIAGRLYDRAPRSASV